MTVPPQDCKTPMPSDKPPPRQHSLRTRIIHLMAGDHCINRLKITGSLLARTEYEIQLSHEQEILSRLMKKRHDLPTILVMIRTLMSNLSHENDYEQYKSLWVLNGIIDHYLNGVLRDYHMLVVVVTYAKKQFYDTYSILYRGPCRALRPGEPDLDQLSGFSLGVLRVFAPQIYDRVKNAWRIDLNKMDQFKFAIEMYIDNENPFLCLVSVLKKELEKKIIILSEGNEQEPPEPVHKPDPDLIREGQRDG